MALIERFTILHAQNSNLPLEREPDNPDDIHAVAVKRNSMVVGHVPFNLAPTLSAFLRRSANTAIAEVIGSKVNRGAGYGLCDWSRS